MTEDRLEGLLAEFVERTESGEALDAAAFAADHPELAPALGAALKSLGHTNSLFPSLAPEELEEALAGPGARGERIGPYTVLRELGRGGMGRVLEVESDEHPGVRFALKLLNPAAASSPRGIERLMREGSVLERLEHPGIVGVAAVGEHDGTPFVAMAHVEGETLQGLLRAAREQPESTTSAGGMRAARLALPGDGSAPARIARVGARIARAVAAAHDEGVLHRDLKPSNVIITPGGDPVVIDFGLAGGDAGPTLTFTGDVIGTPNYMAPEQARGEAANEASDVFGLGAILYELLTFAPPHPGDEPLSVVDAIKHRPVRPVRRLDPAVPRALETIVMRCLAHRPSRRYASARAVADDLEAFAAGESIVARPPGPVERIGDFVRFHRGLTAAGASVLIILALVILVFLPDRRARDAEASQAVALAARAWAAGDGPGMAMAAERLDALGRKPALAGFLAAEARGTDVADSGAVSDPAVAALARGAALLRAGRPGDALPHLRRAVDLAPGSPLPVVLRGVAARRAEKYNEATDELSAAVRLLPDAAAIRRELALVHRERGRLHNAAETLEAATRLEPDHAETWNRLAQVRTRIEGKKKENERDFGPALQAARRAVTLAGDAVTDDQLRALAFILDRLKQYAEAQAIYRKLLAKEPDNYKYGYFLAFSLDMAHQAKDALREYHRLLEIQPGRPEPAFAVAWIHAGARRGECKECDAVYARIPSLFDPEKAERFALVALESGRGRSPERLDGLAVLARRIGRFDAIIAAVKKVKAEAYRKKHDKRAARLDRALHYLERFKRRAERKKKPRREKGGR